MRRAAFAGAMVVLAAVVGSVPASAAPVRLASTPGTIVEGPRLAGERLFYAEVGSSRRVLRLAAADGTARKLATLAVPVTSIDEEEESPGDFTSFSNFMAASADRLAYSEAYASGNARYQVGRASLSHWSGSPSGPFAEVARCSIEGLYGPVSAVVDADGPRVVSTGCGGGIVVRDYSGPEPVERTISPGEGLAAGSIAIAGRYIAFTPYPNQPSGQSPNRTEVRDWVTDTKVYEVPRTDSFDLQADGTLATSTGRTGDASCAESKLSWYSIAEPTEHVLPVRPCAPGLRIAGGRIAVTALAGGGHALALVRLDGSRTDVARLGGESMRRGGIDFDGTRVAFALANCGGGTDLFTESATGPEPADTQVACPVRILSGRTALGPTERSVPVLVDCEPRGCDGSAAIRMRVGGELTVVTTRRVKLAAATGRCPSGVSLELKLPRAAREEIRRRRTVNGHLIVTNRNLDGTLRATKRRLTLRAAKRDRNGVPRDCAA